MGRRITFDGMLTTKWNRLEDKMPLDDFFIEFPDVKWGINTDVLVLINNERDKNEDPVIVQIEFQTDTDRIGTWHFLGGVPYPDCHISNIKFWAEVPDYLKKTVEDFKEI